MCDCRHLLLSVDMWQGRAWRATIWNAYDPIIPNIQLLLNNYSYWLNCFLHNISQCIFFILDFVSISLQVTIVTLNWTPLTRISTATTTSRTVNKSYVSKNHLISLLANISEKLRHSYSTIQNNCRLFRRFSCLIISMVYSMGVDLLFSIFREINNNVVAISWNGGIHTVRHRIMLKREQ